MKEIKKFNKRLIIVPLFLFLFLTISNTLIPTKNKTVIQSEPITQAPTSQFNEAPIQYTSEEKETMAREYAKNSKPYRECMAEYKVQGFDMENANEECAPKYLPQTNQVEGKAHAERSINEQLDKLQKNGDMTRAQVDANKEIRSHPEWRDADGNLDIRIPEACRLFKIANNYDSCTE